MTTGATTAGQLQLVQQVNDTENYTGLSGTSYPNSTGGLVLDDDGNGDIAYNGAICDIGANDEQTIPASPGLNDNPGSPLVGVSLVRTDNFTTYLMYQPPGGIWVTLSKFNWNCAGTATYNLTTHQWTMTPSSVSPNAPGAVINGQTSDTEPIWKDYFHDFKFTYPIAVF